MKVVFVLPDFNYVAEYNPDYSGSFHLGIAYLSSALKKAGHQTSLIQILEPIKEEDLTSRLLRQAPDLIAFSSFTHQFPFVRKWAKWAKKATGLPVICGGIHPTIDPEGAIQAEGVDMVCIGEGEDALVELCNKMEGKQDFKKVQSIWFKDGGKIVMNPVRPLLSDLDALPFPDRDLFNYLSLNEGKMRRISILASRGCPYNCTYCSNHLIKSRYPNPAQYLRFRSVDNVLSEIDDTRKEFTSLNHVAFIDDTLGLKISWLEEFTDKYKKRFDLPVLGNTRVNLVNNDEVLAQFSKLGVTELSIGIESGNEKIRGEILNRKMSNAEIARAVARMREQGIFVNTYNMVGLPGEHMDNVLETIKLNAAIHSDSRHVSVFQPFPHTALYEACVEKGFLERGQIIQTFFSDSVLKMPLLNRQQIRYAYLTFNVYERLYAICFSLPGRFRSFLEKIIDATFIDDRYHPFVLKLLPFMRFMLFPRSSISYFMKLRFPKLAWFVRSLIKRG